jgi:hypothetical protein
VTTTTRTRTPLWVRATIVALVVSLTAWLVAVHLDRTGNERRLSAIASQIAGRPVKVHCPGVLARHVEYEVAGGTVMFGADGRPADVTHLAQTPCGELDALAEGHRADVLRCIACGSPAAVRLAWAVDTLTHESFHLSGISDEATTECHALATMAWTAQQLGATAEQGAELAALERVATYPQMPELYRMDCSTVTGTGS